MSSSQGTFHDLMSNPLKYAPLLFQQAGLSSSNASFLASGVSAILIFVASIPAFLLADRWGRRASTIYGGVLVTTTMALIGSLYASNSVHKSTGPARWVVIVSIYIFAMSYCMSECYYSILRHTMADLIL